MCHGRAGGGGESANPIANAVVEGYRAEMLPSKLRSLPYLVHTNRELGLMLAGKKPLASFVDGKDSFPAAKTRYLRLFDRHVAEGRLVRSDHLSEAIGSRRYICHRILFALPGEAWSMNAMIELMTADDGWSCERERKEGELLGYEDWMNDHWLQFVFGN